MDDNSYKTSLLKGSIQATAEFREDFVTECLTLTCSECKGEYVSLALHHKFVCLCSCHMTTTTKQQQRGLIVL